MTIDKPVGSNTVTMVDQGTAGRYYTASNDNTNTQWTSVTENTNGSVTLSDGVSTFTVSP